MEKTRKAFVVLAAAVTAGNFGCGSSAKDTADTAIPDTATKDTSLLPDAATKDASLPPDVATKDTALAPDVPSVDTGSDVISGDTLLADAMSPQPDTLADTMKPDVKLVVDASSLPPDAPGPLIMPAGTAYDVLTLADLS